MAAFAMDIEQQLQIFSKNDEERTDFVRGLAAQVMKLNEEKKELREQLNVSQYTCKKQSEDLQAAWRDLNDLQKSMNCDPFVLVLIDGDITLFSDDYIQRGAVGGHDAARDLRKAVFDYFKTKDGFSFDTKIVIHIFANVSGLSKVYQDAKIMTDPMLLRQFLQGFNKEHALCHFVDAGNDKEAADNKVKEEMELFYNNVHCRYIMFAGSGDNSYAVVLRQYSLTDQVSSRVVLVESIPFPRQMEDLAAKFERTRLQGLFRESKIEIKRPFIREENISQPQNPIQSTYASTLKRASPKQAEVNSIPPTDSHTGNSQGRRESRKVYLNSLDQRVDQWITVDRDLVASLKPKKLCNRHFLNRCNNDMCSHSHEGTLTLAQIEALRFIARSVPCQTLYCQDPDCISGHRCMAGAGCERRSTSCWFSDEMHNVDTKVVRCI